jgi:integrase
MPNAFRARKRDGTFYRRWRFEYRDWQGRRRKGTGTTSKLETLKIAEAMQAREDEIRRGLRPPPKASDEPRTFKEAKDEYLAWGETHGGLGGRPWGSYHAYMRRTHLAWWQKQLNLRTLADLNGILPRAERALRALRRKPRSGKTCENYAEALKSFCKWCIDRGYLESNPLRGLTRFDTTPKDLRRALTREELGRLLAAAPPERRLLYEVAASTGLRAKEMRHLRVAHLDVARGGFRLEAAWTKNRKPGFQPVPAGVLARVRQAAHGQKADDHLFYVPTHIARIMKRDLKRAKVPERLPGEGKIDFHALRTTYATFVLESGANVKEAQTLLRHSTPVLTMNTYARARTDQLQELADRVGEIVAPLSGKPRKQQIKATAGA